MEHMGASHQPAFRQLFVCPFYVVHALVIVFLVLFEGSKEAALF